MSLVRVGGGPGAPQAAHVLLACLPPATEEALAAPVVLVCLSPLIEQAVMTVQQVGRDHCCQARELEEQFENV